MPPRRSTLDFLLGLERHGMKPGLERISKLVSLLGNPEECCPVIHVAGTNGKGSTSAMIASVLREAGFRTGLYTSPHLSRFNERIQISGVTITGPQMDQAANAVKRASLRMGGEGPLTFFEFTTAMAFVHFRAAKTDAAVIEAGMGGRFDATNVVTPEVSVITNVSLDHTRFLGMKTADIAREKAGIIKPGRPAVTGEEDPVPLAVMRKKAKVTRSALYEPGKDFSARGGAGSFDYSGIGMELGGLRLGLRGPHQIKNAACALAAIELLRERGFDIPLGAMKAGLRNAAWPGRVEIISKRPLVVLDGAHNPAGARALAAALREMKWRRLILVAGMMADKDLDGVLRELLPVADEAVATRPAGGRSAETSVLAEKIRRLGKPAIEKKGVRDACREALMRAGPGDCVCVTGSLFTVGEARGYLKRSLKAS